MSRPNKVTKGTIFKELCDSICNLFMCQLSFCQYYHIIRGIDLHLGWESVLTIAISTLYGSLVTSASPYKQVNTAQLYVACADSDCTCIYTRNSSSTLDLFIIINYLNISKLYCFWWAVKAVVQCGWWEFNNGVSGNKVRELYTRYSWFASDCTVPNTQLFIDCTLVRVQVYDQILVQCKISVHYQAMPAKCYLNIIYPLPEYH